MVIDLILGQAIFINVKRHRVTFLSLDLPDVEVRNSEEV